MIDAPYFTIFMASFIMHEPEKNSIENDEIENRLYKLPQDVDSKTTKEENMN